MNVGRVKKGKVGVADKRMAHCRSAAIAIVLWIQGSVAIAEGTKREVLSDATKQTSRDLACGPRCVWYVLRHYGQQEDLISLVREIQWPNLESGSTLYQLSNALRKRGIHTRALQLSPAAKLEWPHPVIVHLEDIEDGEPTSIGHYVVWVRFSSRKEGIWDGPAGEQLWPVEQVVDRMSGTVLLTSPVPITDPGTAVTSSVQKRLKVASVIGVLSVLLAFAYLYKNSKCSAT